MSEPLMDLYTEEALVKILKTLYPQNYKYIKPNEAVALRIYDMLEDSKQCTSSLNKIKPLLGGPFGTARSLTMPVIKTIKTTLRKASNDEHALACIRSAAWANKQELIYLGM